MDSLAPRFSRCARSPSLRLSVCCSVVEPPKDHQVQPAQGERLPVETHHPLAGPMRLAAVSVAETLEERSRLVEQPRVAPVASAVRDAIGFRCARASRLPAPSSTRQRAERLSSERSLVGATTAGPSTTAPRSPARAATAIRLQAHHLRIVPSSTEQAEAEGQVARPQAVVPLAALREGQVGQVEPLAAVELGARALMSV